MNPRLGNYIHDDNQKGKTKTKDTKAMSFYIIDESQF
jgi:hypothetical protein